MVSRLDSGRNNYQAEGSEGIRIVYALFLTTLAATHALAGHKDVGQIGNVAYLFYSDPNAISRYDMQTEHWLAPVSLPLANTGTAMVVHDSQVLVSIGSQIFRYDAEGGNETLVYSHASSILDMVKLNNFLVVSSSDDVSVLAIDDLSLVDSSSSFYHRYLQQGLSAAGPASRVYGRSLGLSPGDIGIM